MDPVLRATLQSWNLEPWPTLLLVLTAALYVRGWIRLSRQMPRRFGASQLVAFLAGLVLLAIALESPLDPLGGLLLQVHMLQHLLLMMVVPPLIWLGQPLIPLLRGLPAGVGKHVLGPFLSWAPLRRLARWLVHPVVAWLAFVIVTWLWHVPALYELALRASGWHRFEHVCFLGTGLMFWWPVIRPWPAWSVGSHWTAVPYLLLASLANTVFSAFFAFAGRPLYPLYAAAPRLWGISVLDDQAAAGALMWVGGSVALLMPLTWLLVQLLGSPRVRAVARARRPVRRRIPARPRRACDLLSLPGVGALLRWRHVRVVLQSATFALAALLVADGLFGTRVSPLNLAGVLPWTYWRGIAIVGLVVLGNVSCMACPFVLPRDLARRFLPAHRRWPRWLRLKWPSVALIVVYLWAYEAFALWDRPWLTAWIVIAYFAAALIVDGLFRGAAFCKYVCPIGQYQFVQSMLSPTEVRVRELDVCRRCTTYDCVRGNDESRGCELRLFLPRKVGNLDCTYCLDCIHACPHDNVGILTRVPAGELVGDPYRSSLGRLSRRPDFAALTWVLVFGAFVNALGMVAPFMQWQDRLSSSLGAASRVPVVTLTTLLLLVVLPVVAVAVAGWIGRRLGRVRAPWLEVSSRFAWTLVPLGGAMWLVHLVFHLATSAGSLGPALGRALSDLGLLQASTMAHAMPARTGWLVPEILVLDVGLLCALYLVWRAAGEFTSRTGRALALLGPWALIAASLWALGIWILFQPMQMRGMLTMTAG